VVTTSGLRRLKAQPRFLDKYLSTSWPHMPRRCPSIRITKPRHKDELPWNVADTPFCATPMQAPTTAEAPGYTDSYNDAVLLASDNVTSMQCSQAIQPVHFLRIQPVGNDRKADSGRDRSERLRRQSLNVSPSNEMQCRHAVQPELLLTT
jgi:hypothetical protein